MSQCQHPDVRYFQSEKGAIACIKCGRLFGYLDSATGMFAPYNSIHLDLPREVLMCGCDRACGDDGDIDGPGTCKGLPQAREALISFTTVPRRFAR